MLSTSQKKEIQEQIEMELEKTTQQIEEYKDLVKPIAPDVAIGRISRMDAINNKSVNEAALRSAEEKYKALQFVLTKIDDENFGDCAKCGEQIPIKRILLRPQSVFCVRCAR